MAQLRRDIQSSVERLRSVNRVSAGGRTFDELANAFSELISITRIHMMQFIKPQGVVHCQNLLDVSLPDRANVIRAESAFRVN